MTPTCGSTTVTDVEAFVEPPCTANTTELLSTFPVVLPETFRTTAVYVTTMVSVWVVSRLELVSVPKFSDKDPPLPPTVGDEKTPPNPPACDVLRLGDSVRPSRLRIARPGGACR